jgi:FtsH-binding integral membrane protein
MLFCNRHLSPLQRRATLSFASFLLLTVGCTIVAREVYEHHHPSTTVTYLLAALCTLPVFGIVAIVGRYLARETDEFVRMMVVQSILWGLGITFVVDTFLGSLWPYPDLFKLVPILNIDMFCVSVGFALRFQMWRNR